nr:uncharacterized protein LOC109177054 [Ipomoea batatas]
MPWDYQIHFFQKYHNVSRYAEDMLGMGSCEIPACYNQLQETPKQQTVIKVQEQLITSVAPLWTQGKAFNMNFQVENLLTEATPNKHSLLPTKTLVEIKSQPEYGVKATHFHKSQHQPLTQEAGTKKCLKRKEPDYYSDEGWVRRFINPGDENIKEGENDCEDIVRYAGPVVYPKPFMPANEFYWLLGVDSRDLNGEAFAENVIIQGETKTKVKSANSKHKARTYHCKEEFTINGEAMIVFRKEHVPAKISHRLSPKRYGYFKVRKKKGELKALIMTLYYSDEVTLYLTTRDESFATKGE